MGGTREKSSGEAGPSRLGFIPPSLIVTRLLGFFFVTQNTYYLQCTKGIVSIDALLLAIDLEFYFSWYRKHAFVCLYDLI